MGNKNDNEDDIDGKSYFSDALANRFVHAAINKNNNDPITKILDTEEQGLTMFFLNFMSALTDPLDGIKITLLFSFLYGSTGEIYSDNINIVIKSIESNEISGFTVFFDVNGEPVKTEWVNEYGIWRINNFQIIERNNNVMRRAKKINIDSSVSDKLDSKSKWYKLDIKSGCWLNIYTEGNLDSLISVYDSNKALIAKDDDSGLGYNANVIIGLTERTIFIEVSGNKEINVPFTLTAKTISGNLQNISMEKAVYIVAKTEINNLFKYNSNVKWYKIEVPLSAKELTVYTEGRMDTKISLYNSQRRLLAEDDDSGNGYNAKVNTSAKGTIYIRVEELDRRTGEATLKTQIK